MVPILLIDHIGLGTANSIATLTTTTTEKMCVWLISANFDSQTDAYNVIISRNALNVQYN